MSLGAHSDIVLAVTVFKSQLLIEDQHRLLVI